MATSGVCDSWKVEEFSAGHCFNTTVTRTGDLSSSSVLNATTVLAPGTVYAPNDTITLAGGTFSTAAVVTVATVQLVSATINAGGTGYGASQTFNVTVSGGTFTTAAVVNVTSDGSGVVTTVNSITTPGNYTVLPSLTGNAVTGGTGTGLTLNLVFGVLTVTVSNPGLYSVQPTTFTQGSTSGSGTGATFNNSTWAFISSRIITNLSSTAGLSVGMAVSSTSGYITANTVIARILSATSVEVSRTPTGTMVGDTITFTADVFKVLLIKASPSRTFDHTQTNVGTPGTGVPSTTNVGTDETSGAGYTSGGFTLTNVGPSLPGSPSTTATISFSPNPSWTSATFSTTAAIIYNSSTRLGAASSPLNGRTVAVYDFGGTQTVASGTLTLIMPTNDGSNAILRIA
jgi:hypothetical protein